MDLTSFPLYLDYGANLTYMFGSYSDEYKEDGYKVEYKTAVNMASVNVPVAVTTPFKVDQYTILPYVGLNARLNLFGKLTESAEASGYGETLSESDSVNLFDVDDMDDYPVKRFQVGLNLGVNVQFDNYTVGLGYIKDFAPAFDAASITAFFSTSVVSIGTATTYSALRTFPFLDKLFNNVLNISCIIMHYKSVYFVHRNTKERLIV